MPGTGGAGAPVMRLRSLNDTQELLAEATSLAQQSLLQQGHTFRAQRVMGEAVSCSVGYQAAQLARSSLSLPTHDLR